MNNELVKLLDKWIYEYLKRHNLIHMETDYNKRIVFYYKQGQNIFKDYACFNYTKVDLFN